MLVGGRQTWASDYRGLRGNAPAEFLVGFIVPHADDADGDQVGEITIHVQPVELDIQNHDVEKDPERTDQVEFEEAPNAIFERALMARDGTEGPQIIPDEIVQERGLGSQDLAARQAPPKHAWIAENEQEGHVDGQAGAAHHTEMDEAGFVQEQQARMREMLKPLRQGQLLNGNVESLHRKSWGS